MSASRRNVKDLKMTNKLGSRLVASEGIHIVTAQVHEVPGTSVIIVVANEKNRNSYQNENRNIIPGTNRHRKLSVRDTSRI